MNTIPTEENNLPLFKFNPEVTSQLLIENNESQEFVQVPNICDDLLLTGLEEGNVTWTLSGLPILLNGQNDSQQLLINPTAHEESLGEMQPQQEILSDILGQNSSETQFQNNVTEIEEGTEIVLPLELSDKNFLTDNGLFISNEVINDQVDLPSNCELVSNNDDIFHSENTAQEQLNTDESEIQSSDVSSQETFIDINGLLIPQQSVLNLNCQDLLFDIRDSKSPNKKKKKAKKKNSLKHNSFSDLVKNYNSTEEEIENNSIFSNNEPENNIIKVLNLDGTTTVINVDSSLFNRSLLKDENYDEFQERHLQVEDEPDSTVSNDENINIDELATIITAYQCKKCDFTCNDRDKFLTHFKDNHFRKTHIFEIDNHFHTNTSDEEISSIFKTKKRQAKRFKTSNDDHIQLIINENGELINKSEEMNDNASILNNNFDNEELVETIIENNLDESGIITSEDLITQIENGGNNATIDAQNNFQTIKFIYDNEEYTGLALVTEEQSEKQIMRLKRKQKQSNKKYKYDYSQPQTISFVSNLSMDENLIKKSSPEPETVQNIDKQLIYLCSQCADQFLTVEDCKSHMITVHKLCALETAKIEQNEPEIKSSDPLHIPKLENPNPHDKNKKIIEKFLTQDVLKKRKHKCPIKGCQYRFAKMELLKRHENCHENGARAQFRCPECGEKQSSWRTCSVHLWRCHQMDLDLYACPICEYKGSTCEKLKHHVKIHSEDREYVCPECSRGFKQPSQLRNHRVIHLDKKLQDVPRWYVQKHCDICSKMFADSKCLKKHIQAVHSKLKPFICNVCGHSCARKAMLQMHLRQHTGDKPYSCKLCFYKTGDHNSLRRHTMRHTGDRPYKCPHCDYTAIQSNSYKNHLSSKHPGMSGFFNCTECPFKTVNEETFTSHQNDHKKGLIETDKDSSNNVIIHTSNSDLSNNNDNGIFSTNSATRQDNLHGIIKKDFEMEDDETQNCLFSLNDLTDEQTVDTGGITIPADPDPSVNLME